MDVVPVETGQILTETKAEHFLRLLRAAAAEFQNGEDADGLRSLLTAADEFETLVENDRGSPAPRIGLDRLLPAVRRLYFYIRNRDIVGIADLLEDSFIPLAEKWRKGEAEK